MLGRIRYSLFCDSTLWIDHVEVGTHRGSPEIALARLIVKAINLPGARQIDVLPQLVGHVDQPHMTRRGMVRSSGQQFGAWPASVLSKGDEAEATAAPADVYVVAVSGADEIRRLASEDLRRKSRRPPG